MAWVTKEMSSKARKIANEIGKKYGFKISVTKDHGTLNVAIMQGRKITIDDLDTDKFVKQIVKKYGLGLDELEFIGKLDQILTCDEFYKYRLYDMYLRVKDVLENGYTQHAYFVGELKNMVDELETKIKKELNHYDNSDSMTDYFDTNFYLTIYLGKWDKPYKEVA